MPDIWTHILCGDDIVKTFDDNRWRKIIETRIKLFNLGCQGPDIFLYNSFWPWIKDKKGVVVGRQMHQDKTGDFFVESVIYLKKITNKEDFKKLFTYLCGLMSHFSLDRNAHPYIHYYSGKYDKNDKETYRYKGNHKRLELIIDTILLKEKRGIDSWKYPMHKEIDVGSELPKVIVEFYKYILNKLYDIDDSSFIDQSYKDTKQALRIIHDPLGVKKELARFFDLISKGELMFSSLMYPRAIDKSIDYMNRGHNVWNHPCNKTEVYLESFDDLYNKSVTDGTNMIFGAIGFLEEKIDKSQLKTFYPNISYSTGKLIIEKCNMKYFDSIF